MKNNKAVKKIIAIVCLLANLALLIVVYQSKYRDSEDFLMPVKVSMNIENTIQTSINKAVEARTGNKL